MIENPRTKHISLHWITYMIIYYKDVNGMPVPKITNHYEFINE